MSTQSSRSRLTALGCVALAGGLLLPPPVFAEPAIRSTPILDAARLAAGRQALAKMSRDAAQTPQPAPNADLRSGSFFKSAAGIATLVIFGAGVAYAVYSSSNDRIRSTGR
jgi:hypothetical protein